MTQLTKHFTLEELTVTTTGIDNTPTDEQKRKLLFLATYLLEPIRERFGAIWVNSAYRSPLVNQAIGGATTSQHPEAEAADINPEEAPLETVFDWCRNNLHFGQLILEHKGDARWIHISLPRIGKPNMMVLRFENGVYSPM